MLVDSVAVLLSVVHHLNKEGLIGRQNKRYSGNIEYIKSHQIIFDTKNKNKILVLEACLHCKSVSLESSDIFPHLSSWVKPEYSTFWVTTWSIKCIILSSINILICFFFMIIIGKLEKWFFLCVNYPSERWCGLSCQQRDRRKVTAGQQKGEHSRHCSCIFL